MKNPLTPDVIEPAISRFVAQHLNQTNLSVHSINTTSKHNLHRPIAILSGFQKGASYSVIRIFNNLPQRITSLRNEKPQFKVALKMFLYAHCFYCVDEFSACTEEMYC